MTARPEQQTTRVTIGDERWREFKILAIESDRSIADYLGQLVRDELRRSRKRKRRAEEDAAAAPGDTPPGRRGGRRGRPRSDSRTRRCLTELPSPDRSSRRPP
jgi:hypothetical protein